MSFLQNLGLYAHLLFRQNTQAHRSLGLAYVEKTQRDECGLAGLQLWCKAVYPRRGCAELVVGAGVTVDFVDNLEIAMVQSTSNKMMLGLIIWEPWSAAQPIAVSLVGA